MNPSEIADNIIIDRKETLDKYRIIYDLYAANSECFADNEIEMELAADYNSKINVLTSSPESKSDLDYEILKSLLLLQFKMYEQSENANEETLFEYAIYFNNAKAIYESMFDGLEGLPINFTMELSSKDNLAVSIDKIDKYAESFKVALKSMYNLMLMDCFTYSGGCMPFITFHCNVAGNEKMWNKRLDYWLRCYAAYEDYHVKGKMKTDMISNPGYKCTNPEGDVPNSITKITKYIDEAERLIVSAGKGTFPY